MRIRKGENVLINYPLLDSSGNAFNVSNLIASKTTLRCQSGTLDVTYTLSDATFFRGSGSTLTFELSSTNSLLCSVNLKITLTLVRANTDYPEELEQVVKVEDIPITFAS